MASFIQELENNEALLLMYLADELSVEDHAEVDQMLAGNAGLRAQLAEISSAYDGAMNALAVLDADKRAVPGENHAVRQASRAMKQWQVERIVRPAVETPAHRTRVPTWAYPIGVAAMLLIGTLTWWGGQSDNASLPGLKTTAGTQAPPSTAAEDAKVALLERSLSDDVAPTIADAESQAHSLVASANSSVFPVDGN